MSQERFVFLTRAHDIDVLQWQGTKGVSSVTCPDVRCQYPETSGTMHYTLERGEGLQIWHFNCNEIWSTPQIWARQLTLAASWQIFLLLITGWSSVSQFPLPHNWKLVMPRPPLPGRKDFPFKQFSVIPTQPFLTTHFPSFMITWLKLNCFLIIQAPLLAPTLSSRDGERCERGRVFIASKTNFHSSKSPNHALWQKTLWSHNFMKTNSIHYDSISDILVWWEIIDYFVLTKP